MKVELLGAVVFPEGERPLMAQHSLTYLRTSAGLSHLAYARLVAQTHAQLGYGHTAARREKVSRWEAGRAVPELTAQLAMAQIHHVPEQEVRRLGWPHWLGLATGDAALFHHPWTPDGAVEALLQGNLLAERTDLTHLAATGPFARALAEQWRGALLAPPPAHAPKGQGAVTDAVNWAQVRVAAAETMSWTVGPTALYPNIRGDLRLLTALLAQAGRPRSTSTLLLAARTAGLCGALCLRMAEHAPAERFYLLAARAAAAANAPRVSAACLTGVAYSHLLHGEPESALTLLHAVRKTFPEQGRPLAPLLYLLTGRAHALAGDEALSGLALKRATGGLTTLAAAEAYAPCRVTWCLSEDWAAVCAGIAALHLGHPEGAREHFAPLLDEDRFARFFPVAAHELVHVVDTHLALGEVESAVTVARRAIALHGRHDSPPVKIVQRYQELFAPHRTSRAVRALLGELSAHLPS